MSDPTSGPHPDSGDAHAQIAKKLAAHANPQYTKPSQIHAYARRHLPEHVAAAGDRIDANIISSLTLPYLDVVNLKETLSSAELSLMPLISKVAHAWTWEHPERNAAALRFIAAAERYDDIRDDDLRTPWAVPWAKSPGPSEILARIGSFVSLGAAQLEGRIAVVTAARRERVEIWDLASGQPIRLRSPSSDVSAVAIGPVPGGGAIVSIGTEGGLVRCWLVPGTGPRREAWADPQDWGYFDVGHAVTALSVTTLLRRPHILAGHSNGCVTLVDCEEGHLPPRLIHEGGVTGITSVQLGNGAPAVVSVGVDGTVRLSHLGVWPRAIGKVFRSEEAINAVAAVRLAGGKAAVVTAGDLGSVRVWDLPPESQGFRKVPGHDQDVIAVAAGTGPQGESLVVTGDSHGRLRFVDPDEAKVLGGPMGGHASRVTGLAVERAAGGRAVAVSGGADGIVRSWDVVEAWRSAAPPGAPDPPQPPIRLWQRDDGRELGGGVGAHSHRMVAVAVGRLADGTPVAVTDAGDAPRAVAGHGATIGIALVAQPGVDTAAVSASGDGGLLFWDLTPCPDLPPRVSQAAAHPGVQAVAAVVCSDGTPVAVSAGRGDHALKTWDMRNGQLLGSLAGHERPVTVLAAAAAPGRTMVVSGSEDASLRVWELDAGQQGHQVGKTFRDYELRITALAAAWVGEQLIAVTACRDDPVVRWCDPLAAEPGSAELIGHDGPVTAVAIVPDPERPLAVTASEDHTIRVWDLMASAPLRLQEQELDPLPVPGTVRAIACFDDGGPSAVIAGDDVLAVVRWDALDRRTADRSQRAPRAAGPSDKDMPAVNLDRASGVVVGSGNVQVNYFYYGNQAPAPEPDSGQQ